MSLPRSILLATLIRLLFAWSTGLGVDESYMVSAGRTLGLGYFDHPPAAWWLSWAASHVFQTEAAFAVRLPFILLFALTTWLIAKIGTDLAGPKAGVWTAVTLNLSPVFGVTTGTWVLPDGPLDCALAGAAFCLIRALPAQGNKALGWWMGAGLCAGLALFSKYSAILTIGGAFLLLALDKGHRVWLRRPHPYLAILAALLVFSPVIAWNAAHDWASFAFQGARAGGIRFRPWLTPITLAGEALFVLPWFWFAMVVLAVKAFREGPRERLLACLAAPPILGFALVAAWSSQRILYHWAAPGYLMLFPLLGRFVAESWDLRSVRASIAATAALVLVSVTIVATHLRTDWLGAAMPAKDPTAEGLDWYSLRDDLTARGLLPPGTIVGVPSWRDGGKIARALGPDITVVCLNDDSRQFGFAVPASRFDGATMLLLGAVPAEMFGRIEPLRASAVTLRGRTLLTIPAARGIGFNRTATSR